MFDIFHCRYCDKWLKPWNMLWRWLWGEATWCFCNDDCWIGTITIGVMFEAITPHLKGIADACEKEMNNLLIQIEDRVNELESKGEL